MSNPSVLQTETTLYCAAEPDGRLFQAGEPWPGDAWSPNRGGEAVGKGATKAAMKDLLDAQDTIEGLERQLASKDHDLAVMASERDEATGKLADTDQRALAAEQGQAAADERVKSMMDERDTARADLQRVSDQLTAANVEAAKVPGLVEQNETANQTIADLNGKVADLEKANAGLTADLEAATAPAPKAKKGDAAAADAGDDTKTG